MKHPNCAIVVLSCDTYSDMWQPFFSQFRKYWPQNPFKVYLGSNTKKYHDPTVRTILSHTRQDWSNDLLKILASIKEEYLFLWMEDFILVDYVDTALFIKSFHFMEKVGALHIHMSPYIRPDGKSSDSLFGCYQKGAPYRVNAPGFWNKRHLRKLLIPGENPWKFEVMGSYRSSYFDGYYCIMKQLFQFIRVIEKGSIRRGAYEYCKKNGIVLDTRHRHVDSIYEKFKSDVAEYLFNRLVKIPWPIRLKILEALRRMLASY